MIQNTVNGVPNKVTEQPSQGGGGIGGLLGTILGAAAAIAFPPAAGLTFGAVATGIGAGQTVGSIAGSVAAPAKEGKADPAKPVVNHIGSNETDTAIARRSAENKDTLQHYQDLHSALQALPSAPPEVQQTAGPAILKAFGIAHQNLSGVA